MGKYKEKHIKKNIMKNKENIRKNMFCYIFMNFFSHSPMWYYFFTVAETPKGSLCWENMCGCMGGTDWGVCISRDILGFQLVYMNAVIEAVV